MDPKGLAGYNAGAEMGRLRRGLGLIEFERTKEILLERLPPPPAVIYDIGGAYGEYAFWLTEIGYRVHLFDLAQEHIRLAKLNELDTGIHLAAAEVADARAIDRPDASADVILLFGPLYHLTDKGAREACLGECRRLLKPGGLLFAANITRFASTLNYTIHYDENPVLDDDGCYEMLKRTVETGVHPGKAVGRMYFHRPDELRTEVASAGFADVRLHGVIGPAWAIRNLDEVWPDLERREAIMRIVRLLDREESLMGFSTHFLSVSVRE